MLDNCHTVPDSLIAYCPSPRTATVHGLCRFGIPANISLMSYLCYYFIILDSVLHRELIPLHLHIFGAFIKHLKNMNDCFVHFSFFCRNKQSSYYLVRTKINTIKSSMSSHLWEIGKIDLSSRVGVRYRRLYLGTGTGTHKIFRYRYRNVYSQSTYVQVQVLIYYIFQYIFQTSGMLKNGNKMIRQGITKKQYVRLYTCVYLCICDIRI